MNSCFEHLLRSYNLKVVNKYFAYTYIFEEKNKSTNLKVFDLWLSTFLGIFQGLKFRHDAEFLCYFYQKPRLRITGAEALIILNIF